MRSNIFSKAVPAVMENLDGRRLLSGNVFTYSLSEYTNPEGDTFRSLWVNGTHTSDRVTMSATNPHRNSDGNQVATVTLKLRAATGPTITAVFSNINFASFNGEDGNDIVTATGNMTINTGDENFEMYLTGGDGNDTLYGKMLGSVSAYGDGGNDTISFRDLIPRNTTVLIDTSNVSFNLGGGDGNDRIIGSPLSEALFGDNGDDKLIAGAGNDQLYGGDGSDSLYGEGGHDRMDGGWGYREASAPVINYTDLLYGGSGNDTFQVLSTKGTFVYEDGSISGIGNKTLIFGEDGVDTLQFVTNSDLPGAPVYDYAATSTERSYTLDYGNGNQGRGDRISDTHIAADVMNDVFANSAVIAL